MNVPLSRNLRSAGFWGGVAVWLGTSLVPPCQASAASERLFATPYASEVQYIQYSILKDIALMLAYAKESHYAPAEVECPPDCPDYGNGYRLTVSGKTWAVSMPTNVPIWDPVRYQGVADQVATAIGLAAPTARREPGILKDLETPDVQTLARCAASVSQKLKTKMLNADAHEQAALILAAFGLRERLEPYDDVRWALNRMTAHLAISRWLKGGKLGLEGRYGLATAYALMNLQTNALGSLRELEKDPSASTAWNRALYARITGDARSLVPIPANLITRLELAERVSAISRVSRDGLAAKDLSRFLKESGEERIDADLFFCVFQGHLPSSVGLGRAIYLPAGIPLVLEDVAVAMRAARGINPGTMRQQEMIKRLNAVPGFCVRADGDPEVIDWGAWAMHNHRRLAVLYANNHTFITDMWGLSGAELKDAQEELDQKLGALWLAPCLRGQKATRPQQEEARRVLSERPQIIPVMSLAGLANSWPGFEATETNRSAFQTFELSLCWYRTFPPGTLVNPQCHLRYFFQPLNYLEMAEKAPYDLAILKTQIKRTRPDPRELSRRLRNMPDYSVVAGELLANGLPPGYAEERKAAYLKLAAQDPDYYLDLAELVKTNDMSAAAEYFDKGRINGADPVSVSHKALDYVLYYLAKGQKTKAEVLATEAEEVGSAAGFEAMAVYCAKTRQYPRGLRAAEADSERYGTQDLPLIYIQMVKREDPGYHDLDRVFEQKLAMVFPTGIKEYRNNPAPPTRGVRIEGYSGPFMKGDIVVAVDGKQAETLEQLRYLRRDYSNRTGDWERIPMVVFRGGRCVDVRGTTAQVGVSDYSGPPLQGGVRPPPPTTTAFGPTTVAVTSPEPPHLKKLRLNGISGAKPQRFAIINGKTLATGESAVLKLDDQTVVVRCVWIGDLSASVTVDGIHGARELFLSQ